MTPCPKCSTENQDGNRFCNQCGQSLLAACSSCGHSNLPGSKFCGSCGTPLAKAESPLPTPMLVDSNPERRQLTVMFCDLVDSTRLSTELDPEEHHELLRTYQGLCSRIISRYGGYIAQFLGDGIMVYFGYPTAHEDDPERAVLAGLDIIKEIAKVTLFGQNIRTRAGIATGLVVVGDRIAKGHEWEIGVVGETPNLAARIQGLAQPGQVVIGPTTRHLLGNQFEYEDLGSHPLKGFALPVAAWRVASYRMVENRYKAVRASQIKLVDRRDEQALLRHLGEKVSAGEGQIVLIGGEAGIGKSRLASAIAEWMGTQFDTCVIEMQCSALHTQSALFPIFNCLTNLIFTGDRPSNPEQAFGDLRLFLESTLGKDSAQAIPLFANLLSIPLPADIPPLVLPPSHQRQLVSHYLLEILLHQAQGRHLLLLIEDLHWADPSTLEFVDFIAYQGERLPLMGLFTSRAGFARPWDNLPQVTMMPLKRLPNEDAAELVRLTLGQTQLGKTLIDTVVAKTDGIPLYLQEYTKAVCESQAEGNGPHKRVSAIPSTLHDLLLARLDKLGEAKAVAQMASLLGREFDGRLLQAVWGNQTDSLMKGLEALLREEIIYPKGEPLKPRYVFRHALLQDAAYESLLRSNRTSLHRRVGEVVEQDFPEIEPEWLAQHFSNGGVPDKAALNWEKAGLRAMQLGFYPEAARHFEAALEQLDKLPEDPIRHGRELGMRIPLAIALAGSKGYAVDEVEATYTRARELCSLLGDSVELFPILRGLVSFYIVRTDMEMAADLAHQCWRIWEETNRIEFQIESCDCFGYIYGYTGKSEEAIHWLKKGVGLFEQMDGVNLQFPSPHSPYMSSLSVLIMVEIMVGEYREATTHTNTLAGFLEGREHPFDKAYGYNFLALGELMRGNYPTSVEFASLARDTSEQHGYQLWLDSANAILASAQGMLTPGDSVTVSLLERSIASRKANGVQLSQDVFHLYLAQIYRLQGNNAAAKDTILEPFGWKQNEKSLIYLPECHRVLGELKLEAGEIESGMADLQEAIRLAKEAGAKLFQLRASLSLYQNAPGEIQDGFKLELQTAIGQISPSNGALIPEWNESVQLLSSPIPASPTKNRTNPSPAHAAAH